MGGTRTTVDLIADPRERSGVAPNPAVADQLAELEARLSTTEQRPAPQDPEVLEMLKAAGYLTE